MKAKHPDLRQFDGHWFAFPQSFLSKSREYMSAQEKQAAQIIRDAVERANYTKRDPLDVVHAIQRRALEAIERDGLDAFIAKHSDKQEAA